MMKLLIAVRRHCALVLFLTLSILYGCASRGPMTGADQLTIDRISSDRVSIGAVHARKTGVGIDVDGEVKFKNAMIGTPPDHLVVTIIGPDGKVLYTARTDYNRNGKPTRPADTFNFSMSIPLTVPDGSTMRLADDAAL